MGRCANGCNDRLRVCHLVASLECILSAQASGLTSGTRPKRVDAPTSGLAMGRRVTQTPLSIYFIFITTRMEHTERRLRGSTARGYSGPRPGFEQRLDDGGVA
jgi:hypothetical protein